MKMLIKAAVLFTGMLLIGSCESSTESKKDMEPDSTTQNFTFTEYEFGDGGSSSYFNDVWVFDENNIWAVGYVGVLPGYEHMNVNIMRWNGSAWKVFPYNGSLSGIYGIWAHDSAHIYFANGAVIKYQSGRIIEYDMGHLNFSQGQSVEHLWGSSESNIWGVGPWGTLVHYNGSKWTKLDFDTEYYFYDITGDKETGIAYAVARNSSYATIIVKLSQSGSEIIYNNPNEWGFHSWVITYAGNGKLYLGETGIWSYDINTDQTEELYDLPTGQGINSICAYSYKDIYFFGPDAAQTEKMVHYNGKRFANIELINYPMFGGSHSIGNLTAMTGFSKTKASIVIIKRN